MEHLETAVGALGAKLSKEEVAHWSAIRGAPSQLN